jgi:glutaredoxin
MQPNRSSKIQRSNFRTLFAVVAVFLLASPTNGQPPTAVRVRCIALELYMRSSDENAISSCEFIRSHIAEKRGIRIKVYDLDKDADAKSRLEKIAKAYNLAETNLPLVYGLNATASGIADDEIWKSRLADILRMEVFTRTGCPRCAKAKQYLTTFTQKFPGLQVDTRDVVQDPQANRRYSEIASRQRIGGISFPGFWLGKHLVVGFDNEEATASKLEGILKFWTFDCELSEKGTSWIDGLKYPHREEGEVIRRNHAHKLVSLVSAIQETQADQPDSKKSLLRTRNKIVCHRRVAIKPYRFQSVRTFRKWSRNAYPRMWTKT